MGAMLRKRRLELDKQVFGLIGGQPVIAQSGDQRLLLEDMPLPLGDVIVHHLEVGRGIGHGRSYHGGGENVA